ncbi:MAG: hypothetical protein AAGE52_12300 [Myxococcota bacterium]
MHRRFILLLSLGLACSQTTVPAQRTAATQTSCPEAASLEDRPPLPEAPPSGRSADFTLEAGALIEVVYVDANDGAERLATYGRESASRGGELLARFDVVGGAAEPSISHLGIVTWPDPTQATPAADGALGSTLRRRGYFGVQQSTPVHLSENRIYDFTSAWSIASEPSQMPVIMQVLGTYFQKIGPVIGYYGIAQKGFLGPHPAAHGDFTPHMMGLFEWERLEDHATFNADPAFLEHVDIRNALMERMEVLLTKVIL